MGLEHMAPVQKRHLAVRLHPHLVARVRRDHVQCRHVQTELACPGELAETGAEREEIRARDRGGEVGERKPDVVDARGVQAEDVSVEGGGGGGGGVRGRRVNEVVEGPAGVVGEFGEESLRFGFSEGAHWVFW